MRDIRRRPIPAPSDEVDIKDIPLSLIKESDALRLRHQPYSGIDDLADDIRARGQTTPLFLRPASGGYFDLISGYRRRAALEKLKAETALARIYRNLDDDQAYDLAINENQDRDALTDLERADICLRLQKEGCTIDQIAHRMGWKGDAHVYRHLRIAREAPELLRAALQSQRVHLTAAVAFLDQGLKLSIEQQRDALSILAEKEMSASEFKRHLKRLAGSAEERRRADGDAIRDLKGGGFVLRATRFESTNPERISRSIDVLQTALKKARQLQRSATKNPQEETP